MNTIKLLSKKLTPLFVLAEIYVLYHGDNQNKSSISKNTIERYISTMANVPIVGRYDYEEKNFKGHEISLDVSNNGDLKFIRNTVPIGVIPESFTWRWETIIDKNNIAREYLVVENAYIWNRDVDLTEDLAMHDYGQSMEINVNSSFIREDGFRVITDFYFQALCILGINKNGKGLFKPAFEDSKISLYEAQETYNDKLSKMLKDFEQFTNKKGGLNLHLDDIMKKFNVSEEEVLEKAPNYSELEESEINAIFEKEDVAKEVEETVEKIEEEAKETAEEVVENAEELNKETEEIIDEVADESFEDTNDENIEEVSEKDTEEVDNETKEEVKNDEVVVMTKDEFNAYSLKITELENTIAELENKNKELSFEKHERECQDVVESFSVKYDLDEVMLAELNFEEIQNTEILEAKLYEIIGRNMDKISTKVAKEEKEENKVPYVYTLNKKDKELGFDKYFKR